ncbi:hypothetical protein O6R08_06970 [Cutibacterium equinum]|uniref:Uncharacterized protein n=1 Tax=Cutibacterium equinum TaxID=3016342 RepID=A0ABY7QW40_9ACTN|nr:hypothetical protein [Cutibacterium equinum]WCC79283.1 hypothetical protein O6R08_06970 [Cutibacterium equinum]
MLEICCRLTCLLNDLCAGRTTDPHAEAELLTMATAHHVQDPDEVLSLSEHDPLSSVPIRMALARIAHVRHDSPVLWGLLLPAPGQLAGLRGPASVNQSAIDAGAVIICHQGCAAIPAGTAWIPQPVGSAMQWTIRRAAAPLPPPTPSDATVLLRSAVTATAAQLSDLGMVAGERPEITAPHLTGHRPADQRLLDSAWTVLTACDAGLASTHHMITAHSAHTREAALRTLRNAASQAITAATSWPLT